MLWSGDRKQLRVEVVEECSRSAGQQHPHPEVTVSGPVAALKQGIAVSQSRRRATAGQLVFFRGFNGLQFCNIWP